MNWLINLIREIGGLPNTFWGDHRFVLFDVYSSCIIIEMLDFISQELAQRF